ncbi:MAG TPA: vanadium-dependent haloperoxidase [Streptosporangiaceae bacterium]|nr:vanadium-dependent haloperoxidase [Streptosporangiaceae bacterium]
MPDRCNPTRRSFLTASALAASAAYLLADGARPAWAATPGSAGTALAWHDITSQTVSAGAFAEPVTQSRAWAVSWLAAARAVLRDRNPDYGTAALAQALHDALAAQVPSQQTALDASLAAALESVPNGRAKQRGIAAGAHEASVILAERAGDGLDTTSVDIAWPPPPATPGVFQLTPPLSRPAIRAGEGNARPFLLERNDQFDPGPPLSLDSPEYNSALAEVESLGAAGSPRTAEQTEVASFWYPAIIFASVQITRAILAETRFALPWQVRFVAAFNVIATDAQIATYNAKYKYLFWRPYTAITTGGYLQEPTWTSFWVAPQHPEYPSGHGGQIGSQQGVLNAFVGLRAPTPIPLTSPDAPGVTRTYTDWQTITDDVVNARVWEGVHFRTSDITGVDLGLRVARWELRQLHRLGI